MAAEAAPASTLPPPPDSPACRHPRGCPVATVTDPKPETKDRRPNSSAFKVVPETREQRDRVRAAAADFGKTLDRSAPLTREGLRAMAVGLLTGLGLGEEYLGFAMVAVSNEFWREQVQA